MNLNPEDPETWEPRLELAAQYEVDPFMPAEAEAFFAALFEEYTGPEDRASVAAWSHSEVSRAFVCIGERPNWIQGAEWPFHSRRPLLFAGQLDVPGRSSNAVSPYHDDTSLYIFTAPGAAPGVITQQY